MRKMLPWHNAAGWRGKFTSRFMETVTINREHAVGLSGQFGKLCFRRWETVRRAANVAERRSDKMNVFIF